jgi:hypothetical protein
MSANRKLDKMDVTQLATTVEQSKERMRAIRQKPAPTTQAGRDAVIAEARDEQRFLHAAQAQLQTTKAQAREQEKQSNSGLLARMRWAPEFRHTLSDEEKVAADKLAAERKEFHSMLKTESDKRNEADLQRKRDAGLLYEPVGFGGGDGAAALFSCATLWGYVEQKLNPDGKGGFVNAQLLTARQILHLWWAANLIEEAGGEQAQFVKGTAPHWPDRGGDILYREPDMARLVEAKFLEWERGIGSQSLVTIRYGSRARKIIQGYRESRGT